MKLGSVLGELMSRVTGIDKPLPSRFVAFFLTPIPPLSSPAPSYPLCQRHFPGFPASPGPSLDLQLQKSLSEIPCPSHVHHSMSCLQSQQGSLSLNRSPQSDSITALGAYFNFPFLSGPYHPSLAPAKTISSTAGLPWTLN